MPLKGTGSEMHGRSRSRFVGELGEVAGLRSVHEMGQRHSARNELFSGVFYDAGPYLLNVLDLHYFWPGCLNNFSDETVFRLDPGLDPVADRKSGNGLVKKRADYGFRLHYGSAFTTEFR